MMFVVAFVMGYLLEYFRVHVWVEGRQSHQELRRTTNSSQLTAPLDAGGG